jgi:ubiquinol-cytochrome c reductase cytochrome b subunit
MIIVLLVALPFISNTGEKSWRRRPFSVLLVIGTMAALFLLAQSGLTSPWSPHMSSWSGDPIPPRYLAGRTPLEVHGAIVIQNKQCRNCHSLGGLGGERGPALDGVATRLTVDQLVRQVIQGSGNMPAYGKNLSPPEVSAVVAFMETLRPGDEPVARDATRPK